MMPCTVQRAKKLRKSGRARLYSCRPYCIQLLDRKADDPDVGTVSTEVRVDPGPKHTGIAVVMRLANEDRIIYQEEISHRADISQRLLERKSHRRRRRGTKWFRPPRFDNRKRKADQLPPSLESIVSNQVHRRAKLARLSGARTVVVESAKFDTQKVLRGELEGVEYQQGPLYRTHLRAFVAERERHRCAYCGKGDWEDATRFNLDHIAPRARGGASNIRNLVWSCEPCNQAKGSRNVEEFLKDRPERLASIRKTKPRPLAAAGKQKWLCDTLVARVRRLQLQVRRTTGADTAAARRANGAAKTHANDAACAGAVAALTRWRKPQRLKAVGHGRRKQIKGLPTGKYLAWRHAPPRVRRATPAPGHAGHPHRVYGIESGDHVQIRTATGRVHGRATVYARRRLILVRAPDRRTRSTTKKDAVLRLRGRCGYIALATNQT